MTCGGLVSGSVVWEVGSSRLFSESIGVRIGGGCVSVCWRAGSQCGLRLRPKKCRAPRRKIRGSIAPLLHSRVSLSQKQNFCSGSKSREALGPKLYDKNFRAPGLQRSPLPFGTLTTANVTAPEKDNKLIMTEIIRFCPFCNNRNFGAGITA